MNIKNLFYPLSLAMAAMTLTACSSTEGEEAVTAETAKAGQTGTFQVSINVGPAQTRAISVGGNNCHTLYTNWDNGDKVRVVQGTTKLEQLTADVSAGNTAYATLTGTLTGTFNVGDELTLYYHVADLDYTGQTGTIGCVSASKSFLTATSTVQQIGLDDGTVKDGSTKYLVMSNASYDAMQAYLDITFTDTGGNPLAITQLDIWTSGGKLVKTAPLGGEKTYATEAEPLIVTPEAGTDHFFLALRDEASASNTIYFKATTADNTYTYSQESNLAIGGYYYAASPKAMTGSRIKPTITRGDGGTVPDPDQYHSYTFTKNGNNPIDVTISGTSKGYYYRFNAAGTVHLNNLQAEYSDNVSPIINGAAGDLTIDITGDNSLSNPKAAQSAAADANNYNLYLRGNGTLTVSCGYSGRCGLFGKNYQNGGDPSVLAADGYTVTRSDATAFDTDNNGSTDYYTWTYTVTPLKAAAEATAEDIGKVIGDDGNIYADADVATAASHTAMAKICYVGNSTGVAGYTHGLALALTDEGQMDWTTAGTTCSSKTPTVTNASSWMLPSKDQWTNMINGAGDKAILNTMANLQERTYWSSWEETEYLAWGYDFYGTHGWTDNYKSMSDYYVRACLAF